MITIKNFSNTSVLVVIREGNNHYHQEGDCKSTFFTFKTLQNAVKKPKSH